MYIPATKYELVNWMASHYNEPKTKFIKVNKKQLYAIYFSIVKKQSPADGVNPKNSCPVKRKKEKPVSRGFNEYLEEAINKRKQS